MGSQRRVAAGVAAAAIAAGGAGWILVFQKPTPGNPNPPSLLATVAPGMSIGQVTPAPEATPVPVITPSPTPTPMPTYEPMSAPRNYPPAGWVPYSATSVFNAANADTATVDPNSATYLRAYAGKMGGVTFGYLKQAGNQFQSPMYFGGANDPVFKMKCKMSWAKCVGSDTVHIPLYAIPADASDGHMGVIDTVTNKEYDAWGADKPILPSPNPSGTPGIGTWNANAIVATSPTGSGLNSEAVPVAAGYALWAGIARAQEIAAGNIPHALQIVVPCTANSTVYPSYPRDSTDTACPNGGGPPYGAWIRLNMTDAQINALNVSRDVKTIAYTLKHRGALIADTNGGYNISVRTEADTMYTAPGYTDPGCKGLPVGVPCTPLTSYEHASQGDKQWTGDRYYIDLSPLDLAKYGQVLLPPPK